MLLDTCTAIWCFEGSARIPERLRAEITDPANDVFFSDVSLLELVIKHQIGKMPVKEPIERLMPALIAKHGFDVLPISTGCILRLASLPMHHRDPFDRLLVAQALTNGLTLITPDPLIARYQVHVRWG